MSQYICLLLQHIATGRNRVSKLHVVVHFVCYKYVWAHQTIFGSLPRLKASMALTLHYFFLSFSTLNTCFSILSLLNLFLKSLLLFQLEIYTTGPRTPSRHSKYNRACSCLRSNGFPRPSHGHRHFVRS